MMVFEVILGVILTSLLILAAYLFYLFNNIGKYYIVDHLEVSKVRTNDRRNI